MDTLTNILHRLRRFSDELDHLNSRARKHAAMLGAFEPLPEHPGGGARAPRDIEKSSEVPMLELLDREASRIGEGLELLTRHLDTLEGSLFGAHEGGDEAVADQPMRAALPRTPRFA